MSLRRAGDEKLFGKAGQVGFAGRCVGCWKVYGDAETARRTFEAYHHCTDHHCKRRAMGETMAQLAVGGDFDALAFGRSAQGAEVLEESEFEPMFADCEKQLSGKRIALFGSYDWGDGEWMRSREDRCRAAGAVLASDSVICNLEPDADGQGKCKDLGAALAK